MSYDDLLQLIHGGRSPYQAFPMGNWARTGPNWGSTHEWITDTVREVNPALIVEVGSFLGASAMQMASVGNGATILCIDTWLGGVDHRLDGTANEILGWHFGRPSIFYSFIANVMQSGYAHRIIPFPLDTLNAARFLNTKGVTADMIYIDASHERGDVRRDLEAYWPLLRSGGVMLVDDLTGHFRGLVDDVNEFVAEHGLTMDVLREKGRIMKP